MKNLILILAMAVSTVSFSQLETNAFAEGKPLQSKQNVEKVYKIEVVSYAERENTYDEWSEYKLSNVEDLVNPYVFYRKEANALFLPTVNSGVIPVLVGEVLDRSSVDGDECVRFNAEYLFQENLMDCYIISLENPLEERDVIFFQTDLLMIVYEVVYEGLKPQGRGY